MSVLHLTDVPPDVYERLRQQAAAHRTTAEAEALEVLRRGLLAECATQAEVLAELYRRRIIPPLGTPDSVELLREDRDR